MTIGKYDKALNALVELGMKDWGRKGISRAEYAAKVYAELTAPVMETVEVKRWVVIYDGSEAFTSRNREDCENWYRNIRTADKCEIVELTGTYSRPIEEKEEVLILIVKGNYTNNRGVVFLPKDWCGEEVEIRRLKGA